MAVSFLCSCAPEGLNFKEDRRVRITSPRDRATVRLPVSVEWEVAGALPPRFDGFGVFFDRAPQPPGRPMAYLARRDRLCERRPDCPDEAWYRGNGIYRTAQTNLEVASLLDTRPPGRTERREAHIVTIVYLDPAGRRLGESAFSRDFFLTRK